VERAVHKYHEVGLKDQASLYSTLKYLNASNFKIGTPHPSISTIRNNTGDVYRGMIKTRLLTGTYQLQSNRKNFNHLEIDKICLLCKQGQETSKHMLAECSALAEFREHYNSICPINVPSGPNNYIQLILDATKEDPQDDLGETPREELEFWGRRLCYKLHAERAKKMAILPTRKRYGL
jgi:hypothetical protein